MTTKTQAKFNQAVELHKRGQFALALSLYEDILKKKPRHAAALHLAGVVALQTGNYQKAADLIGRAIALAPGNAAFHSDRGLALQELKQPEAAVASYDKAIALRPDYAEAHFNRGNALQELDRPLAAIASFDRAIALKADFAEAHFNRGVALLEVKQVDAAIESYDKAISCRPDYAEVYWNKSLALLLRGDFANGWKLYEFGWGIPTARGEKRGFSQPLWLGKEDIAGKTILLHAEQGFGDAIQFCRYAKLVADLGARVILEAPKRLTGLFAGLEGVAQVVEKGKPLPAFDCHCPLLSLPLAFKTDINTIPASEHYLRSDPAKVAQWRARLGEKTKPRIGLVWSGKTTHTYDRSRSLSLSRVIRHLPAGFQYVSLQKEIQDIDKPALQSNPGIVDSADAQNDFSDAAALCELMDVVISVDTSVAHLAGALGRPTWVLLPFVPDWRWLFDRTDSPWYPSVKLYRQEKAGDWDGVLSRVEADLLHLFSPAGFDRR